MKSNMELYSQDTIRDNMDIMEERRKMRRSAWITIVFGSCLILTGSAAMLLQISAVWGFLLVLIGVIEITLVVIICVNPCSDLDDEPLVPHKVLVSVPETPVDYQLLRSSQSFAESKQSIVR
ncbi:uncharacterized protein LOC135224346 [Macrobrachium nipponense]|uniref:uncharacterized protein LOC135224346 n=1 Tax=Macrobrachium nipponense TaxID=159736 RepID=UPI0030C86516